MQITHKIFSLFALITILIPTNIALAIEPLELPTIELPTIELPSIELSDTSVVFETQSVTECTLTASTYEVEYGGSVTLTWETKGFDTIKVNDKVVHAENGSVTIENITDNNSYTLQATNANGDSCTTDVDIKCNAPDIQRECKLDVRKVADKTEVAPGEIVNYTLTVTNTGDANCTGTGVWIEDILSADHEFVSYTVSDNVYPGYHPQPVYNEHTHRLQFNGQTLVPGEVATIGITTKILSRDECGDYEVINKARASALELNEFGSWRHGSSRINVANACPVPDPIPGCMDMDAKNYNAKADTDDHSCVYPAAGCTDTAATNYDAAAEVDNNSCEYPEPEPEDILGCTDVNAQNYTPAATANDGSCVYPAPSCEFYPENTLITEGQSTTLTWNVAHADRVTLSEVSGDVALTGEITVTPNQTFTYELNAFGKNDQKTSCVTEIIVEPVPAPDPVLGCTDVDATNYDAAVDTEDGSCTYPEPEQPVVNRSTGGGGSTSPRCELEASAAVVFAGADVTLTWDTKSTNDVTVTDSTDAVVFTTEAYLSTEKGEYLDHSIVVRPTEDMVYTLVAERGNRDAECDVSVTVIEPIGVLAPVEPTELVAGISLSSVPYTGGGNVIIYYGFYALMFLWVAAMSFAFVTKGMKPAFATETVVDSFAPSLAAMNAAEEKYPSLFAKY